MKNFSGSYKAISLWQPWASLVAMGLKKYETRSWSTNYRGRLVICSAQRNYPEQAQAYSKIFHKHQVLFSNTDNWFEWDELPRGYAVAIANLTDCIKMTDEFIGQQSQLEIDCGEWSAGRFAWKLEQIGKIILPIKITGKQGLFKLDIDLALDDLEEVA
ncbi:ASCH domain-containing protein [Anabaena sp. CCY 9910]|uniref:ASCH domain-containing protein n=1 Tax=Anabaena sp. CCY 9910 TaxID=3103870 RepID=UPI0039DF7D85